MGKYIKTSFFVFVIFCIKLIVSIMPTYRMYQKGIINETVFNEVFITGDYQNAIHYGFICVIIVLVCLNYIEKKTEVWELHRYKSRMCYVNKRLGRIISFIGIILLIHVLCDIIFISIYGNWSILLEHKWLMGTIIEGIILEMYYVQVYLVYFILTLRLKSSHAAIVAIVIFVALYYMTNVLHLFLWTPVSDITIIQSICVYSENIVNILLAIIRNCCVAILLYEFLAFAIKRKDFIASEKK